MNVSAVRFRWSPQFAGRKPVPWARVLRAIAFLLAALVPLALSDATAADKKAEAAKPNIIWIMADDLGYGDLGCFGQKKIKTPRLDRMAAEGIRFTSVYAGSTVCAPSRCVLMTGLHTGHCQVRGNAGGDMQIQSLRPGDLTVAELLKRAGYATALCGKWGLGHVGTAVETSQVVYGCDSTAGRRRAKNPAPE